MENNIRKKYKLIDHTADFGIQVVGSDSKELFINAALALFETITETNVLIGQHSINITALGKDWPDLMVNWLREVLYLWNGKEFLVKSIQILFLSENKISAKIYFDGYKPDRHIIKTEIKAVTYHQIQVNQSATAWDAQIIFDI